jgi:phosphoglycolate phosphatase-like HAD superfamily hydrolase
MKNLRVVAFDCDGVLFDTAEANRAYYNHILAHFGRPPMDRQQLLFVHTHTLHQA